MAKLKTVKQEKELPYLHIDFFLSDTIGRDVNARVIQFIKKYN